MSILDELKIKKFKDCKNRKERFKWVLMWVLSALIMLSILLTLAYGILCHLAKDDKATAYADTMEYFGSTYSSQIGGGFTLYWSSYAQDQSQVAVGALSFELPLFASSDSYPVNGYASTSGGYSGGYTIPIKSNVYNGVYSQNLSVLSFTSFLNNYNIHNLIATETYFFFDTQNWYESDITTFFDYPSLSVVLAFPIRGGDRYPTQRVAFLILRNVGVYWDYKNAVYFRPLRSVPDTISSRIYGKAYNAVLGVEDIERTTISRSVFYGSYGFGADAVSNGYIDTVNSFPKYMFDLPCTCTTYTWGYDYFGNSLGDISTALDFSVSLIMPLDRRLTYSQLSVFNNSLSSLQDSTYLMQSSYNDGVAFGKKIASSTLTEAAREAAREQGFEEGYRAQFESLSPFEVVKSGVNSLLNIRLFGDVTVSLIFQIGFGIILFMLVLKIFTHG